jgi:hypothetical protein
MRPFGPAHAGERGGFITFAPNSSRFLQKALRDSRIAIIHLRWNWKKKMIPTARFCCRTFQDVTLVEGAAPASTRIYSNDQHVETCGGVLGIDSHPVRHGGAIIFASPD